MNPHNVSTDSVLRQLGELPDWEWDGDHLLRDVQARTARETTSILDAIAQAAEHLGHYPDVEVRQRRLSFVLSTFPQGVTQLDIDLARRIEEIATSHGAS